MADREFRFISIDAIADMSTYSGPGGREKLAREARFLRQAYERMIAEEAARGELYAPKYVIDYAVNEQFWLEYFARIVRPSRLNLTPPPVLDARLDAAAPLIGTSAPRLLVDGLTERTHGDLEGAARAAA